MAFNHHRIADITGNLVAEPEVREAGSAFILSLVVYVNEGYTGRDGQKVEKTFKYKVKQWFNGENASSLAQKAGSFLSKGDLIRAYGVSDEPDTWIDKEGNAKGMNVITINRFGGFINVLHSKSSGPGVPDDLALHEEDIPF